MNTALSILGFAVFFNGVRIRVGLTGKKPTRTQIHWAVAVCYGICLLVCLVAGVLLEALGVSVPTFWVAAGCVITIRSLFDLARGSGAPWPLSSARSFSLVPLVFPLLLTPELVVHSLARAADVGLVTAVELMVAAVLSTVVATRDVEPRLALILFRFQAVGGVVVGVAWLVEGSRSLVL